MCYNSRDNAAETRPYALPHAFPVSQPQQTAAYDSMKWEKSCSFLMWSKLFEGQLERMTRLIKQCKMKSSRLPRNSYHFIA